MTRRSLELLISATVMLGASACGTTVATTSSSVQGVTPNGGLAAPTSGPGAAAAAATGAGGTAAGGSTGAGGNATAVAPGPASSYGSAGGQTSLSSSSGNGGSTGPAAAAVGPGITADTIYIAGWYSSDANAANAAVGAN